MSSLYRLGGWDDPYVRGWLLGELALNAADIAWRRLHPPSHARWRELPAAAFRLLNAGHGRVAAFLRRVLSEASARCGRSGVHGWMNHFGLLLFSSNATVMLIMPAKLLRFR